MNNNQINNFARKWLNKYKDIQTTDNELEYSFGDECFELGFKMDSGKSFIEAFPRSNGFEDSLELEGIIEQIDDINLLGALIFSKWREITHWSYSESLSSDKNRAWFIIAFDQLVKLSQNGSMDYNLLKGQATKIKIISNNICYDPAPKPEDEVEQHLTLYGDGRVWFTAYNFGEGFEGYIQDRKKQFRLDKVKADKIFSAFTEYFSTQYEELFVTDIGEWQMIITNESGEKFEFKGSSCANFEIDGMDLSDMLREMLGIDHLFVFDGDNKPDQIERIEIEYHRQTITALEKPINEKLDHVTWDYDEHLTIDRETETIKHIQQVGADCLISHEYQIKDGIAALLDDIDTDWIFEHTEGNPDDVVEDLNESKDYVITIDFKKAARRVISGSFDKNGLPDDWPEFADNILTFISFYGYGEILNPLVYGQAKRCIDDYIFCSVMFHEDGREYYYLADHDTYRTGDFVLVPAGSDNHTAFVRISKIEYFSKEKAPFPVGKAKHIIRKCNDEDIENAIEENELEMDFDLDNYRRKYNPQKIYPF